MMCSYKRAYPNATITWRLGNRDISSMAEQFYTKNGGNSDLFDSHSNITFTPVNDDVGKILYCEASHRTLTDKKSTSMAITVICKLIGEEIVIIAKIK